MTLNIYNLHKMKFRYSAVCYEGFCRNRICRRFEFHHRSLSADLVQ